MNKLELTEALKKKCDLTQTQATNFVTSFFSEMAIALAKGERIELRGLWSFYVKDYKSYTGRNPKTGKLVRVKSKKLPFFKCGKELKERSDFPPN